MEAWRWFSFVSVSALSYRNLTVVAFAVSSVAFIAYTVTVAPTITWQHDAMDSAELASAVAVFGIPHPTGYPLWLLVSEAWIRFPTVQDLAGRLSLFSAFCGALASGVVAFACGGWLRRSHFVGSSGVGALTAGFALSTSTGVWNVAVVAETYALHTLLISLIFAAAVLGGRLVFSGVLTGLCAANHVTGLPFALLGVLRRWRRWTDGLWAALGMVPGLLLYGVLLWRAREHPPMNWGDPESIHGLWVHVSGQQYHYLLLLDRPLLVVERVPAAIHDLAIQFSWLFWPLSLIGLAVQWRDRALRLWLIALAVYVLIPAMYAAVGVEHYELPALVILAFEAGVGVSVIYQAAHEWLSMHGGDRRWLTAGVAVVVLLSFGIGARISSLRGNESALLWAEHELDAQSPHATIATSSDQQTFPLWYAQLVLHIRPDVHVIDQRLVRFSWYSTVVRSYEKALQAIDAH